MIYKLQAMIPVLAGLTIQAMAATPPSPAVAKDSKWKLVWSDEFDYRGLPDPKKWGYEEGFVRNNEPQYYTKARLENARVENGTLVVEGRKETFPNPSYDQAKAATSKAFRLNKENADYTSASLNTSGKATWTYGRFEMRAKIPVISGAWPAFWTLGENRNQKPGTPWPVCGELDILEGFGKAKQINSAALWGAKSGDVHHANKRTPNPAGIADEFHLYAMEWYPDRADFFFDEMLVLTIPLAKPNAEGQDAFKKPHYLLVNLALGSSSGPIEDDKMPQRMIVDYVRVYQQK